MVSTPLLNTFCYLCDSRSPLRDLVPSSRFSKLFRLSLKLLQSLNFLNYFDLDHFSMENERRNNIFLFSTKAYYYAAEQARNTKLITPHDYYIKPFTFILNNLIFTAFAEKK